MYSFNNDYSEGAHPRILEALMEENLRQNVGYGLDCHGTAAANLLKKECRRTDVDIHLIPGGTQTNLLAVSCALRPHQAVLAAETGHVNVHETGAVEATGHKVVAIAASDGKLTPKLVDSALQIHTDEHMVQPKMVYISNSTEVGTQYSKTELETLSHFCRQHDLYLFLDGARLGSALTSVSNDLTIADIASLVDLFYIGGTKNGALFGEALVICSNELKSDFRYLIKQKGAMLAKGWLLGIQFEQLFQNHLFYDMAAHANQMAELLRTALQECNYPFQWNSTTNQLFPILPDSIVEKLSEKFLFSLQLKPDHSHSCIRLVTSWATKEEAVQDFIRELKELTTK